MLRQDNSFNKMYVSMWAVALHAEPRLFAGEGAPPTGRFTTTEYCFVYRWLVSTQPPALPRGLRGSLPLWVHRVLAPHHWCWGNDMLQAESVSSTWYKSIASHLTGIGLYWIFVFTAINYWIFFVGWINI